MYLLQERAKANAMRSLFPGEEMEIFGATQVDEYRNGDTPTPTPFNVVVWIGLTCKDGQRLNDGMLLT